MAVTGTATGDPLLSRSSPTERFAAAHEHIVRRALSESPGGRVGLELELHLVDLEEPSRRPTWAEVTALVAGLPTMPSSSTVTLEPGGQVELSTPPAADVATAVALLRADRSVLREALRDRGYGAAPIGADPARPVQRICPAPRYAAMETHFDALGCAGAGRAMMTATAALQVNLDAGPADGWSERLGLVRGLIPVLVALSSTSPYLAGRADGWHSMRQGVWQGIDHGRSDPFAVGEPTAAWADYALQAPVMLRRSAGPDGEVSAEAVTTRVTFAQWLGGGSALGPLPTVADLDYHLTTLFPPVRPRGYVELRCLDALPDRWWPAVAAVTTVLVEEPAAAAEAARIVRPVIDGWERAAREGMRDPGIARAVLGCLEVAAAHAPEGLRAEVEELVALFVSGSSPAEELRRHADRHGPLSLLEEEARA